MQEEESCQHLLAIGNPILHTPGGKEQCSGISLGPFNELRDLEAAPFCSLKLNGVQNPGVTRQKFTFKNKICYDTFQGLWPEVQVASSWGCVLCGRVIVTDFSSSNTFLSHQHSLQKEPLLRVSKWRGVSQTTWVLQHHGSYQPGRKSCPSSWNSQVVS